MCWRGVVSPPKMPLWRNEACSVSKLGAGAGLTYLRGPGARIHKVTFTDGDDGVLDLLRKNCHRTESKLEWPN